MCEVWPAVEGMADEARGRVCPGELVALHSTGRCHSTRRRIMKRLPSNWAVCKGGFNAFGREWRILENGIVLDARPTAASACRRAHQIIENRRKRRIWALAGVYR